MGADSSVPRVAVWDNRHNVHFYDRRDAMPLGELHLAETEPPEDLTAENWRAIAETLRAPNDGPYLPGVYLSRLVIHQSADGRMRLYHFQDGSLILEVDGRNIALDREQDGRFLVAGLDRALGMSAAFNDAGLLHIFQQHVRVGTFEIELKQGLDARLNLVMPEAQGQLILSDGERILVVDSAGQIKDELVTHYTAGALAVSPNGELLAVADIDDNLVRVYAEGLRPTHQKHAIDLMVNTRQVQLLASLPGRKAGLGALEIADDGTIAFALGGVACVTDLKALDELPQPQPLL
jgi:hypothetical protein